VARATLLLVDDEPQILSALQRALRRERYEIRTAESARAALASFDAEPADLVLSDHKMPGMSGVELLAAIAIRAPRSARVLISGWVEEIPPADLDRADVHAVLPKPWDDAELKRVLRAALDAERAD